MVSKVGEIDLATVKERAVKGVFTLTGRTFILQIISFLGFFFLTVFLDLAEIGLFFAVSEIVAILGYFSDIGLAAALIQKKEVPNVKDVRSTFAIQQTLVITLVSLIFLLTPWLANFYHISRDGVWLLWALTAGFFLASLKTIPSVLLERKLRFDLLALVEIVESFFFYGLAVTLAWKGWGITSYTIAVLARGIVGVVLIFIFSPWQIGFAFEKESLRNLLKFGLPYQANSFLAVVKDRLMNVFLWKIIGVEAVGVLGWAQKWAQMPLRFIMDSVMKVTFPAFSRMQDNKEELKKGLEKSIYFISLFTFPLLAGMAILAKPLMQMIPQYGKWEIALIALYLYIFNSAWAAITTPLTNVLSAIGKIKIVFWLMVMWTALTWILFPAFGIIFGYNGIAFASALVSLSSLVAVYLVKKYIDFNLISSIFPSFLATLIMSCFLLLLLSLVPSLSASFIGLLITILISAFLYFGILVLILGKSFFNDIRKLLFHLRFQHDN